MPRTARARKKTGTNPPDSTQVTLAETGKKTCQAALISVLHAGAVEKVEGLRRTRISAQGLAELAAFSKVS